MDARQQFAPAMAVIGMTVMFASAAWADDGTTAPADATAASSAPARVTNRGAARINHQGTQVTAPSAAAASSAPLSLQSPPLEHVVERQQLRYMEAPEDPAADDDQMSVKVQKNKAVVNPPMGQFQAVAWALLHPTQAWRIFTPVLSQE